jgi:hypothetical protein
MPTDTKLTKHSDVGTNDGVSMKALVPDLATIVSRLLTGSALVVLIPVYRMQRALVGLVWGDADGSSWCGVARVYH